MPGLLDLLGGNFGVEDPRQAAYLALASGLLSGRGNFNQIVGNSMIGAQDTFQKSRHAQQQAEMTQMQMDEMKRKTRQQAALDLLPAQFAVPPSQPGVDATGGMDTAQEAPRNQASPDGRTDFRRLAQAYLNAPGGLQTGLALTKAQEPVFHNVAAGGKLIGTNPLTGEQVQSFSGGDFRPAANIAAYNMAVMQGYKGSITDWQTEGTKARANIWAEYDAKKAANKVTKLGNLGLMHGVKSLSEEQNQALFGQDGAVTSGRLDPNRINSRTASIFADAELTNPGTDFSKMSADIALSRNATFRQRAMIAETLPEIMKNMVDQGKKVDFNDVKIIGRMQAWVKDQTNDPELTQYMSQRNDALMTIAGVMRGVGMTDQAHRAETEVAAPTMSPAALDGWLKGQMLSLQPRLNLNRKITRDGATQAQPSSNVVDFGSLK